MKEPEVKLSTSDNPFNPHTEFDEWRRWDTENGYYTLEYIARTANTSSNLTDKEYDTIINNAIDIIIQHGITGTDAKYIKVYSS